MTETTDPARFNQAELTDRLARDAQNLASLGVPLHMVGEAFMEVGIRFEVAASAMRRHSTGTNRRLPVLVPVLPFKVRP